MIRKNVLKSEKPMFLAKEGKLRARWMAILAALAATAVVGMGCGSGGDSTSGAQPGGTGGTTPSPDKASFVKEANATCTQAREGVLERIEAYEKAHHGEGLSEGVSTENAFKAVLLSTIETEIASLRKLGAPAGDEEEIEAILTELQKNVGEGHAANQKMSVGEVEEFFNDADKKLREYGLGECTKNG